MARVIIDGYGAKRYFNDRSECHREDGPAIISPAGSLTWRFNGEFFRKDGPVIFYSWGTWADVIPDGMKYDSPNGHKESIHLGRVLWPEL